MYRALHRIIRILQPTASTALPRIPLLDLHLGQLLVVRVDLEVDRVDLLLQLLLPVLRLLPLLPRPLSQLAQLTDHFVAVQVVAPIGIRALKVVFIVCLVG
jgi:hypothetical protein